MMLHEEGTVQPGLSRWVPFTVTAEDGHPIGARRLAPVGQVPPADPVDEADPAAAVGPVAAVGPAAAVDPAAAVGLVGRIVVASATGVPQGFYRRFGERAAGRGYEVVTFDYRGIGDSAPADLRGFRMDYRDWGRLDLAAVVRHVDRDGRGVLLVGHSFGGMALGLLPDPGAVRAAYLFGTGTGWPGFMPGLERVRVAAMWNLVGPVVSRTFGYVPWRRFGMGEDLPLDVYRQWRSWSGRRRFWFDDPAIGPGMRELYAAVTVPIVAATSVDDRWIPPASRDAFFAFYRNADVVPVDLNPAELGLRALGHLGYFRSGAETLWDAVLARFNDVRAAETLRA